LPDRFQPLKGAPGDGVHVPGYRQPDRRAPMRPASL
jgi:hypothetical protein